MGSKIKLRRTRKAKVLLWTDVSYHDMEEINKTQSVSDLESALCGVFGAALPEPSRGVLLELFVQAVLFCRERKFKNEQTSALLSIIKSIHEANIETPLNNIEQCVRYCKELLLCHSVRRPPFSINLFNSQEVNSVLQYISDNYLRHYKLYKYIFAPRVKLDLSLTYSGVKDDSAPDVENVLEDKEQTERPPQTPGTSIAELQESALVSKSELKLLIEDEVRKQMAIVSGRLDEQLKEITKRALESIAERKL